MLTSVLSTVKLAGILTVCLSVRQSRSRIVSRRLKISSNFFLNPYPHHSSFFDPERRYQTQRRTPSAGGSKYTGMEKFAVFDWNRRLSRKQYEIDPWLLWNVNRKSSVADRSVSVPMALRGVIFQAHLLNNIRTVWTRTTKFGRITLVGEGRISRGQPRLYRKGRGPSAPRFWGLLSIYTYTLCHRTTKFDVVTHVGRGMYPGVSQASHPKRA